jgi:hypothetical protein
MGFFVADRVDAFGGRSAAEAGRNGQRRPCVVVAGGRAAALEAYPTPFIHTVGAALLRRERLLEIAHETTRRR